MNNCNDNNLLNEEEYVDINDVNKWHRVDKPCEIIAEIQCKTEIIPKLKHEEIDLNESTSDSSKDASPKKRKKSKTTVFDCAQCSYKTTNKPSLKSHVKFHSKNKPFLCKICDYRTVDKSNLKAHIKVHTGERAHKCTVCPYATSTSFILKQHMTTHTGEKLFKCKFCDYSSGYQSSVRTHMLIHGSEKLFKCPYCDYKSAHKSYIKNHIRIHTDERPFQCKFCEYKAKRKYSIKLHVKRIHNDNNLAVKKRSNGDILDLHDINTRVVILNELPDILPFKFSTESSIELSAINHQQVCVINEMPAVLPFKFLNEHGYVS